MSREVEIVRLRTGLFDPVGSVRRRAVFIDLKLNSDPRLGSRIDSRTINRHTRIDRKRRDG